MAFLKSAFDRATKLRKQGLIAQNALEDAEHSLSDGASTSRPAHNGR